MNCVALSASAPVSLFSPAAVKPRLLHGGDGSPFERRSVQCSQRDAHHRSLYAVAATIQVTMSSRQQVRKVASIVLAVVLALWAEIGVATDQASAPPCRVHTSHMHSATAAAMHGLSSACCPRHLSPKPGRTSHLAVAYRPDCCTLSNQPARALAFLIASRTPMESTIQVLARTGPGLVSSPSSATLCLGKSPPFTKLVFDKKTDFRI